jgi:hypothetical protein
VPFGELGDWFKAFPLDLRKGQNTNMPELLHDCELGGNKTKQLLECVFAD